MQGAASRAIGKGGGLSVKTGPVHAGVRPGGSSMGTRGECIRTHLLCGIGFSFLFHDHCELIQPIQSPHTSVRAGHFFVMLLGALARIILIRAGVASPENQEGQQQEDYKRPQNRPHDYPEARTGAARAICRWWRSHRFQLRVRGLCVRKLRHQLPVYGVATGGGSRGRGLGGDWGGRCHRSGDRGRRWGRRRARCWGGRGRWAWCRGGCRGAVEEDEELYCPGSRSSCISYHSEFAKASNTAAVTEGPPPPSILSASTATYMTWSEGFSSWAAAPTVGMTFSQKDTVPRKGAALLSSNAPNTSRYRKREVCPENALMPVATDQQIAPARCQGVLLVHNQVVLEVLGRGLATHRRGIGRLGRIGLRAHLHPVQCWHVLWEAQEPGESHDLHRELGTLVAVNRGQALH
eukprot:scaffold479_cov376-Prasinococcus_capsulatus_cf.AAC.9